jgi:hypothetical protein
MKTLQQLLHDGDPVGRETDLTLEETEAMRRAVLGVIGLARSRRPVVRLAFAVGLSVAIGVGAWFSRLSGVLEPTTNGTRAPVPAARVKSGRHQVQFASPGGTRIIWVFDSNFDLR